MPNNPKEVPSNPHEAVKALQAEIVCQLQATMGKADALRIDFERMMAPLQKRCLMLEEIISVLGHHASNPPQDGRFPEAEWQRLLNALNTLP